MCLSAGQFSVVTAVQWNMIAWKIFCQCYCPMNLYSIKQKFDLPKSLYSLENKIVTFYQKSKIKSKVYKIWENGQSEIIDWKSLKLNRILGVSE